MRLVQSGSWEEIELVSQSLGGLELVWLCGWGSSLEVRL